MIAVRPSRLVLVLAVAAHLASACEARHEPPTPPDAPAPASEQRLAAAPLVLTPILKQMEFRRGESLFAQVEIRNNSSREAVVAFLAPFPLTPELRSTSAPDTPIFLNAQPTDGHPVAPKTIRIDPGATESLSSVKIHFRAMKRDDPRDWRYFADVPPGTYHLRLTADFREEDRATWSGILKSDPVTITVVQ